VISVSAHYYLCVTAAYKHADGKKIDGRRVLVDVERARTVKGWLPRRLGKPTF
jgi:U1 small nuclear ribonucleoprotein